jgi:hypothetical protein
MNRVAAFAAFAVLALAACSQGSSTGPSGAASAGTGPASTAAIPDITIAPSLPSQTTTAWGKIWDDVPDSFFMPTGAQPATDTGAGPVSGQLVVAGDAAGIADGYVTRLRDSGWTVSKDGPLEDTSIVVSGTKDGGCKVQVTVKSIGDASTVAILFGASCPFE